MMLCSRAKCGCMAGALLLEKPTEDDVLEFTLKEITKGNCVGWEDREEVWAEKCEVHQNSLEFLEEVE